jgi:hypothetical protein
MGSHSVQTPDGEQAEQPSNGGKPVKKRRTGLAYAGFTLVVVIPVLGLIISLIGLEKIRNLADAGKGLSIGGIVVSPPAGASAGTSGTPGPIGAGPATVDLGCVTAASAGRQMTDTLNADKAAMSRDQVNPLAQRADLQHLVTDLQALQRLMTTAEGQATHPTVKSGISAIIGDLDTFSSGLQAVENGDLSQVNQITTAADSVKSDSQALKTTCMSASLPAPSR